MTVEPPFDDADAEPTEAVERKRRPLIPRPPPAENSAAFAQQVFVMVIALILVLGTVGVIVIEIMDPAVNTDDIVLLLAVITAALFGFVCGRSSLRDD